MKAGIKLKKPLLFEWDKGNKEKNVKKHNVLNAETEETFFNKPILLKDITHSAGEERYIAFGVTDKRRHLIIFFTLRGKKEEIIRVISSRDQDRKEKDLYQKMKIDMKRKK